MSIKAIIAMFQISDGAFRKWRKDYEAQLKEKDGQLSPIDYKMKPTKRSPKKPKYGKRLMGFIKSYTINREDFHVKTLIDEIKQKYSKVLKPRNIYYILKKMGITHKRSRHRAIKKPKDHKKRVRKLIKDVKKIGLDNILSIDECSLETNMVPTYGWSPKGEQVLFLKRTGTIKRVSMIAAISNERIIHYEFHSGTVNSDIYLGFLKKLNRKCRNKVYLMDNASIHKAAKVKEHMKGLTNRILYNVPYSPETNPIEQLFSPTKQYARRQDTHTLDMLKNAVVDGMNQMTKENFSNFYRHSFERKV